MPPVPKSPFSEFIMKPSMITVVLLFVLSTIAQPAQALEDGGPKTLKLGENKITKNGFGTREKMFLSLYEGTLYLKEKSSDAKAIIAANEAMAVRIKITSRFVSQQKMVDALNDGFQAATGGNTESLKSEIQSFRGMFADPIKMKDVFILAYIPDKGVIVYKNNKKKGTVAGLEFKKALFGIWLGDKTIDKGLKKGMLGK